MALRDTLTEEGEAMAPSSMFYVCCRAEKLLLDTLLSALCFTYTHTHTGIEGPVGVLLLLLLYLNIYYDIKKKLDDMMNK